MTVDQLISILTELPGDSNVLIVTGETWPIQTTVRGVHVPEVTCPCCETTHVEVDQDKATCRKCGEEFQAPDRNIYLVEGSNSGLKSPYGPKEAFTNYVSL